MHGSSILTDLPRPFLFGVVHLAPTPGAPRCGPRGMRRLLEGAERDARALLDGGCHGIVVENFGDAPFFAERVPPETVAALTVAVERVKSLAGAVPVGVNVLRNDARSALGIAAATGARFIRVNVHTGAMYTDQGLVTGRAAETLRVRRSLAPDTAILADVHVKHATPPAGEELADAARDASTRGMADALVVSGAATGSAPDAARLWAVREAVPQLPLIVGSGLDGGNASELLEHADGAIVGTALKREGRVDEPVDEARVRALRRVFG